MKNRNILIAIVTVIIGTVSGLNAQGFNVDFDKGTFKQVDFMEAVKSPDSRQSGALNCGEPKPEVVAPAKTEAYSNFKSIPNMRRGLAQRVFSPAEIASMDETIGYAINYANNHRKFVISASAARLLKEGTPEQKLDFISVTEGSDYDFPWNADKSASSRCGCVRWGTTQTCVDKNDCKTVCTAGQVTCHIASYVAGTPQWVCGAGAAVCNLVCTVVPVCTSTPICLEMSADCEPTHG
ncbi:MAG: hypothetical protein A2X31_04635 [Elusimicrobia bacterium GWB2_63_22]|nr:MAG: hypothetical protein A2X31_04635 [Elusimicrobia bacterium GWB2_63_22]